MGYNGCESEVTQVSKSKFEIGDLVAWSNQFSFSPAEKVVTVGKVGGFWPSEVKKI
jgi:hypothetical protein